MCSYLDNPRDAGYFWLTGEITAKERDTIENKMEGLLLEAHKEGYHMGEQAQMEYSQEEIDSQIEAAKEEGFEEGRKAAIVAVRQM